MKKLTKFNPEEVVRVIAIKTEKSQQYKYFPEERGFLGGVKRCGGIYSIFSGAWGENVKVAPEDLPNIYFIENQVVYIKPCVRIVFKSGDARDYHYNTYEEVLVTIKKLNLKNWKTIEGYE